MWMDKNSDYVFYYKLHGLLNLNTTKEDNAPFLLEIQMLWQLEILIKFGYNRALSMDATFGTSKI